MTTAQVVETSVTVTNSSFQNYTHPDDHTTRTTDTPGFKPFTTSEYITQNSTHHIHFTHTAQLDLQVLFKVQKLEIINYIAKKPFNRGSHSTHGCIIGLHLGSEGVVPEWCLQVNAQRVYMVPIYAHRLTSWRKGKLLQILK